MFAPDGGSLAFSTADRVLKRVSLTDSVPETVTNDIDLNTGGTWGPDGRIIYGRDGALWVVPAAGGVPQRLTTLDSKRGEVGHRWPIVIPGGAVLFTSFTSRGLQDARIEAVSLATGDRRTILEQATFSLYASTGHLLFCRDDALLGVAFDEKRLAVIGSPVPFIENIGVRSLGAPFRGTFRHRDAVVCASVCARGATRLGFPAGRGTASQRCATPVREPARLARRTPLRRRGGER